MKTLIAIPAMEQMYSITSYCLDNMRRVGEYMTDFLVRLNVDTARNLLAKRALEEGCDRILWIDSDMTFEPDLMERLSTDLDEGWDMVSGLYFKRSLRVEPVIYKSIDKQTHDAVTYWDYPQNALFPVAGCGFGGVMMKTDILNGLTEPPFKPLPHIGEDLSFCLRMEGKKIACDSRVKMGHLGTIIFSESMYKHPKT